MAELVGKIVRISGPVIEADSMRGSKMSDVVRVGEENLMVELKELMKKDTALAKIVLNLIDSLDRNEWKFFY